MKTIVGLFQAKENALSSLDELTKSGITQDHIRVLTCNASGQARIREEQNRIVGQYASLGVLLGIAVAGTFGLVIGLSALPIYGFGLRFLVIALIAFAGIGTALGGLLGALYGLDNVERVAALCNEGIVSRIDTGQYFGEIELIHGGRHIATIQAAPNVEVEVVTLDCATFDRLMAESGSTRTELDRVAHERMAENVAGRKVLEASHMSRLKTSQ